jgi:hypothetical protein
VNGVMAATIALTAPSISIPGSITGTTSVTLTASAVGGISETVATGVVTTPLLLGSSAGDAILTGPGNRVSQLGSFKSGGTFNLKDGVDLLISGPVTAPLILVDTGPGQITLANGATITTSGSKRPPGVVTNFPGDKTNPPTAGAFLTAAGFTQLGSSTIQGDPSILRINVAGPGNITFANPGLQAGTTWLILNIDAGQATGNVFVQALDVIRNGASGATLLTGSVAGLSGPAAAGAAGIQPSPNSNFRFNSCPIHSVNCVLLPTQGLPTANPLNDISIGTLYNPDDQDDLLLPIVSDQDY